MHLTIHCAAFAVGIGLGLASAPDPIVKIAALTACAIGACALVPTAQPARTAQRATFLLLLALGVMRGQGAGALGETWGDAPARETRLQEYVVTGASRPGPRCVLDVQGGGGGGGGVVQLLSTTEEHCEIASGQRIRILGSVRAEPPVRPGAARAGRSRLLVDHWWVVGRSRSIYWRGVARLRVEAWRASRTRAELGLLAASGLGLRQALPPADRRALQRSGLGHLVAISGLHVALLATIVHLLALRISTLLGRGPSLAVILGAVPVVGYVLLTGAAPPAVRAAGLLLVFGLGVLLGRPVHAPTALAQVLALMLALWPTWLLDAGFQLSAAAMAALVSAPERAGPLRISWRIAWALAPLELLHFGAVPLHGVLLNLIAIPIFTTWVLPTGLMGLCLLPWLGGAALEPASWGARLLLDLAAVGAEVPPTPPVLLAIAAGLSLGVHVTLLLGDRHAMWARARAWLVPMPAALAVLLAWRVQAAPAPAPAHWIAWGSWRSPAIVRVESRRACVYRAGGSVEGWPRIGRELQWPAVVGVSGTDGRARAVREELRRDGAPTWLVECPGEPPRRAIRDALRACIREREGSRGAVRIVDGRAPACFVGDRWRALPTPASGEGQ